MSKNEELSPRQKQKLEQQAEALRRNLALRREQGKARHATAQDAPQTSNTEKSQSD